MENHEYYMRRCLDLAIKGIGHVAPNPMVGSVIVHNGQIIGEGYHQQFGKAHAEVNAINSVKPEHLHLLPEATLYVNLEPCAHHGKTPPCADLIVNKKMGRVVIASNDPNPQVAGKGIKILQNAGIEVTIGVLKKEADFLNRRFLTFFAKHRPYIILKWAESADGFMAPDGDKQLWLTNEASRKLVHQWRSEEMAIMVGKRTVEIDDPALTVRLVEGKNPMRVVIDRELQLPLNKKIFNHNTNVYVFNELKQQEEGHIRYELVDFKQPVLPQLLKVLTAKNIQSLFVEGGPHTLQQFIEQDLWDEACIFTAPLLLHNGKHSPPLKGIALGGEDIDGDKLKYIANANAVAYP